ncbi:hypothetical protein [Streptomyces mirabilis]|uniref:hypothetical protein n=1 Tax=Streptomyces mirabilis TaxID=68239 RepID=UPI002250D165|nr:hypothetical protein [Streptomyces mirabilis]MCX4609482.1 hypothetical protein [Streptomyces mirabilis]
MEATVRDFLRLCLDPGRGIKRTPAKLAGIMPGPLEEALMRFAPHLGDLRTEADRQEAEARRARNVYVDALAAWITGDHSTHERDHIDGVPWPQCLNCSTEAHTVDWTVPDAPVLCPQNRRGDKAVQEPHFYKADEAGVQRCVFCDTAAHWGGEPTDAYRTPDGRAWTLVVEVNDHDVPLYEAPFVGTRFTALALETLHGEITAVANGKVPEYVYNSRSVNRTTKHIPDGKGRTICPGNFQASKPMPEEEAARLTLCGGCRKALLAAAEDAQPGCAGAAIDHDETGICTHA